MALHDTIVANRRFKAYKCEFATKSFKIKDAIIRDNLDDFGSVGGKYS